MTQNEQKKAVAVAALTHIKDDMVIGIGTGSTVNYFIEALASIKHKIDYAVSSSEGSTELLKKIGIQVVNLNYAGVLDIYIDGADECNAYKQLIKGGGGALTREKILAVNAKKFVCIIDKLKQVDILGSFPVPIEVIPMARSYVAKEIIKLGGQPVYREEFITDNGNIILDIHNMKVMEPKTLESELNNITGVVTNGIFAHRAADVVLIGTDNGVETQE